MPPADEQDLLILDSVFQDAPPDRRTFFLFTKLPTEIQRAICESLCGHCGKEDDPMAVFYHDPAKQTQTLMNLCLVSRHMRSLAQHILYHYPRVYSYTDFFRTLQARPDLSDSVKVQKEIYTEEIVYGHWKDDNLPYRENIGSLRDLAVEMKLMNSGLGDFNRLFHYYPNENYRETEDGAPESMRMTFDNLIMALIMAFCARLELLSFNVENGRLVYFLAEWSNRYPYLPTLAKQRPEGLVHLHTLLLRRTMHYSRNILGLDHVSCIWTLFPNVKRLIFFEALWGTDSPQHRLLTRYKPEDEPRPELLWKALPHIKELRFLRYSRRGLQLPLPAIQRYVSKCTSLEKFAFSPVTLDGPVFRPSLLVQGVVSPTLQHLILNCPIDEAQNVDPAYLVGTELQQFTGLRSLIIDEGVFCRHHHDPENATGSECLTNMLPANLETLTVNIHAWLAAIIDIIALGDAVTAGRFAHLRYLRVQMTFEDRCWPATLPPERGTYHGWGRVAPEEGRPDQVNEPLLEPRKKRRRWILDAFKGTKVRVDVDFFRRLNSVALAGGHLSPPLAGRYSDARLVDSLE